MVGLDILFSNQKFRIQNSNPIFFDIIKTQIERAPSELMNYLI